MCRARGVLCGVEFLVGVLARGLIRVVKVKGFGVFVFDFGVGAAGFRVRGCRVRGFRVHVDFSFLD